MSSKAKVRSFAALLVLAVAFLLAALLGWGIPMEKARAETTTHTVSDAVSLARAMATAQEGDTVQLTATITFDLTDAELVSSIWPESSEPNKDLVLDATNETLPAHSQTLDLNGNTLTIITGSQKSCFTLVGGVTLTIMDSKGGGKIVGASNGNFFNGTAETGLVLEDVAIEFGDYADDIVSDKPAISTAGSLSLNKVTYNAGTSGVGGPALVDTESLADGTYVYTEGSNYFVGGEEILSQAGAVAAVEGTATAYTTLQAAVDAIPENSEEPVTVTLLADITEGASPAAIVKPNRSLNWILDLNGHDITVAGANGAIYYGNNASGTITIRGEGTLANTQSGPNCAIIDVSWATGVTINLEGGTYRKTSSGNNEFIVNVTNANNLTALNISGGFFKVEPDEKYLADNFEFVDNDGDGIYEVMEGVVAKIGNVGYTGLGEAFAEANDGDTITLLADMGSEQEPATETSSIVFDKAGASVTFDLNGHSLYLTNGTVHVNNGLRFMVVGAGTIIVTNSQQNGGVISASGNPFRIAPDQKIEAKLVLEKGVKVIGQGGPAVSIVPQESAIVSDGSAYYAVLETSADLDTPTTFAAIQGNGTSHGTSITVNGGKLTSNFSAIYQPQFGKLVINDGVLEGQVSGMEIRGGSLEINGGEIIAHGEFKKIKNENGSTLYGVAVAVSEHTTEMPITVTINKGTFTATDPTGYAYYQADTEPDKTADVKAVLHNGTFNGAVASETVSNFIENGTFSEPVESNYLVAERTLSKDEDGNYVVSEQAAVAEIVRGEKTYSFADLATAFAEAEDEDTIRLVSDEAVIDGETGRILIEKRVIFDLNGYTLTIGAGLGNTVALNVRANGGLTLTDSSENQTGTIDATEADKDVNEGTVPVGTMQAGAKLTVLSGTIIVDTDSESCVFGMAGTTISIEGGTFINLADTPYVHGGGTPLTVNIDKNASDASAILQVTGGTFIGRNPALGDDSVKTGNFIPDTVKLTLTYNEQGEAVYTVLDADAEVPEGTPAVYSVESGAVVATVYTAEGLEEALAEGYATVRLGGDIQGNFTISKALTLDLNGKKLSSESGRTLQILASGVVVTDNSATDAAGTISGQVAVHVATPQDAEKVDVTIKNVSILSTADDPAINAVQTVNAKLTLDHVNVTTYYYAVSVFTNSELTIRNSEITATATKNYGETAVYIDCSDAEITDTTINSASSGISIFGQYGDGKAAAAASASTYNTLSIQRSEIGAVVYAVANNGAHHGTVIEIADSNIAASVGTGIFHPGYGTLTVSGGSTVSGESGIEMRAGILTIKDETVSVQATAKAFDATPSGNGNTLTGVAVGISQHTTNLPVDVTLSEGTYSTAAADGYAFYEVDLQDNVTEGVAASIQNGTFNGAIAGETVSNFIEDGIFSEPVESKYLAAADAAITKNEDGNYVISSAPATAEVTIGGATYTYSTLAEAVAAVPENNAEPAVIKLIGSKEVIEGGGIIVDDNKNIVFDFNGKTYNVVGPTVGSPGTETNAFQLKMGSTVVMQNGKIDTTCAKIVLQKYCDLTLINMDLDFSGSNTVQYVISNNNATTIIEGNTIIKAPDEQYAFDLYYWPSNGYDEKIQVTFADNFKGEVSGAVGYGADAAGAATAGWQTNAALNFADGNNGTYNVTFDVTSGNAADANILVEDGTFSAPVLSAYLAENMAMAMQSNGTYTVIDEANASNEGYVASVDNGTTVIMYESLQAAIDAAGANAATITLYDHVTESIAIAEGQEIILDLNGHILTSEVNDVATVYNDGTLKIVDTAETKGKITREATEADGSENTYYVIANHGVMTLDGIHVSNENAEDPSSLIINNIKANGVYEQENPAKLTIESGTYFCAGSNVVKNDEYGVLIIKGGEFTCSEPSGNDYIYAVIQNWASATITGGIITHTDAAEGIAYSACAYGGQTSSNDISGGTFSGTTAIYLKPGEGTAGIVKMTISGDAEIHGVIAEDVTFPMGEDDSCAISGGSFSDMPRYDYFEDGFVATWNDETKMYETTDGYFTAAIGDYAYTTLAEAIAAAENGDTIVLIRDITVTETIQFSKGIIFDLNGKTITSDLTEADPTVVNPTFKYNGRNDITFDNGTIVTNGTAIELVGTGFTGVAEITLGEDLVIQSQSVGVYAYRSLKLITYADITARSAAIQTHGSIFGITNIDVLGGNITSTNSVAMYLPQKSGTINISGGTISGTTGIEVRNGTLNITGGTIIATGAELETAPNGSGSTVNAGAAVAVSKYANTSSLKVSISGGTLEGVYAFYEANLNADSAQIDKSKIAVELTGGTYKGAIGSENLTGIIKGGRYAQQPAEELFNENYVAQYEDGFFVPVQSSALIAARANAQADVRSYAASFDLIWEDIETLAKDAGSTFSTAAVAVIDAYDDIASAASEGAVAKARLSAMNALDTLLKQIRTEEEADAKALATAKAEAISQIDSAKAASEDQAAVVVPTATYLAINSAETVEEVAQYLANALAEIKDIRTYRSEISGQTSALSDLAQKLEAITGEGGEFDSLLSEIKTAISGAQEAIVGEGSSATLASVQQALEQKIKDVQDTLDQAINDLTTSLSGLSSSLSELKGMFTNTEGGNKLDEILSDIDSAKNEIMNGNTNSIASAVEEINRATAALFSGLTADDGILTQIQTALDNYNTQLQSLTGALSKESGWVAEAIGGVQEDVTAIIGDLDSLATGSSVADLAAAVDEISGTLNDVVTTVDSIAQQVSASTAVEEEKENALQEIRVWLDEYLDEILGVSEARSAVQTMTYTPETTEGEIYAKLRQAFSEENAKLILKYYNDALASIDAATTVSDVTSAISTFQARVASVEAAAQNVPEATDLTVVYVLLAIVLAVAIAALVVVLLKKRQPAVAAAQPAEEQSEPVLPAPEAGQAEEKAEPVKEELAPAAVEEAEADDDKEQIVIAANVRSFGEAYVELSDDLRDLFRKVKEYALSKEGASEVSLSSGVCIKRGSKQIVKLTVRRGYPVALFLLENEMLKDFRRNASAQAKLKIRATELVLREEADLETAYTMVDLSIDQIEKDIENAKERRREARRARRQKLQAEAAAEKAASEQKNGQEEN